MNIAADCIDVILKVCKIPISLRDSSIAILAETATILIRKLNIEPLEFNYMPKKSQRRTRDGKEIWDHASGTISGMRLDHELWKNLNPMMARSIN